ncbi:CFC_collapsed_G0047720.mRNA.1.CDS.1 [Saccharomyces cerevisiae]|nr:CFC_collapsed_G0047720.mRNA.1.CDS.1 [Saccharomyces cerevisiae]
MFYCRTALSASTEYRPMRHFRWGNSRAAPVADLTYCGHQSGALSWNANAEKLQLSRAASTKTVSSFASHSSWHFSRPSSKSTAAPLSSIRKLLRLYNTML